VSRALRVAGTAAVLLVAVAPWMLRMRLPDPVATHWGLDGRPDASLPFVVDAFLPALLLALVVLLPARALDRADRATGRSMLALLTAVSAVLVMLRGATLRANLDVAHWSEAGRLTPTVLVLTVAIAVAAAALGWWLGARLPERAPRRWPATAVHRSAGEALVWHGRASAPPALLAVPAGALAVASLGAVVTPSGARVPIVVGAVLLGVLGLVLGSVRVTIGPAGLVVRLGAFGWPRIVVDLAAVEAVEVEDVEPLHYGGWGWRVVPGVRAIVVRRGEALRVRRRSAPTLVVTVDDAPGAASVLAALGGPNGA
jgi:uncharacterized membrane protein